MTEQAQLNNLTHLLTTVEIELLRAKLHAAACHIVDEFLQARLTNGNTIVQNASVP